MQMRVQMDAWVEVLLGLACVLVVHRWVRRKKGPNWPINWPIVGALFHMEKRIQRAMNRLSEKYGPVVYFRLGAHSAVVCSSPDAFEGVLKEKDLIFASRPSSTIQLTAAKYLGFDSSDNHLVVGKDRAVDETDFAQMEFLQVVFKETFRLHSPTPVIEPHFNHVPTTICGYDIPANTAVFINTYSMGRNPRVWDDPLTFRPERFLEGGDEIQLNGTNFRLLPFGSGRRSCVGMNLALLLVKRFLTSIVHAFDWMLPPGSDCISLEESSGSVVRPAAPLTLIPVPRLPTHIYETDCQVELMQCIGSKRRLARYIHISLAGFGCGQLL